MNNAAVTGEYPITMRESRLNRIGLSVWILLAMIGCATLYSPDSGAEQVFELLPGKFLHLKGNAETLRIMPAPTSPQEVADRYLHQDNLWAGFPPPSLAEAFRYALWWKKIAIHNPQSSELNLFVVCTESSTAELHVAIVHNGVIRQQWHTGSNQPFLQRPFLHRQFLIPFNLQPNETVTVLVGMETAGDGDFLRIEEADTFWQWRIKDLFIDSVHFGCIIILTLLILLLFVVTRDRTTLYLYGFVLNSAVHNLSRDGFLDQFFYPATGGITHPLTNITVCLSFLFIIMFFNRFLEYKENKNTGMIWLSRIMAVYNIAVIVAVFTTDPQVHTPWVVMSSLLSVPYLIIAWTVSIVWGLRGHYHSRIFSWIGIFLVFPLFLSVYYFYFKPFSEPPFWLQARSGEILFTVSLYVALLYDLRRQQLEKQAALLEAEARTRFFATMNHELRTPLNGVIGTAELLSQTDQTPIQKRYSETIISSGNLLLSLINDILDLTKVSEGKLELENRSYDLETIIFDCIASFLPDILKKNVPVYMRIPPDIPINYIGDQHRIRQIIYNLVSNAMKFTEGGHILISVDAAPTDSQDTLNITIAVEDTGIGIPQNAIDKIFNQFSQADVSTTRRYGGSGLGLAICKAIVKELGGNIAVESTVGKGSKFIINFLSKVDTEAEKARASSLASLRGKHILMVSDLPMLFDYFTEHLHYWGVTYSVAESEEHAHKLIAQQHFDCLLLYFVRDAQNSIKRFADCNLSTVIWHHKPVAISQADWKGMLIMLPVPASYQKLGGAFKLIFDQQHCQQASLPPEETIESLNAVKILVVEDNPTNQMVALGMLRNLGLSADSAENGQQAVEMCQRTKYALIFMDCEMPVLDGYAAAQRILEQSPADPPVIIALTAQSMESARDRCFEAGMRTILYKPITIKNLKNCLLAACKEMNIPLY